jgi:hypothetical protein
MVQFIPKAEKRRKKITTLNSNLERAGEVRRDLVGGQL